MGSTKVELVQDLKMALTRHNLTTEQREAIRIMIKMAERGNYHDFDSNLATPKIQLHIDLHAVGLNDIDTKMQQGAYDDEAPTPEQEQELMESLIGKKRV